MQLISLLEFRLKSALSLMTMRSHALCLSRVPPEAPERDHDDDLRPRRPADSGITRSGNINSISIDNRQSGYDANTSKVKFPLYNGMNDLSFLFVHDPSLW